MSALRKLQMSPGMKSYWCQDGKSAHWGKQMALGISMSLKNIWSYQKKIMRSFVLPMKQ